jgi:hypothetical protein
MFLRLDDAISAATPLVAVATLHSVRRDLRTVVAGGGVFRHLTFLQVRLYRTVRCARQVRTQRRGVL